MARNLVVCLDGTGNRPKDAEGTNVEILYSLLDLSDPQQQIAYYDPGVGTFAAAGAWTPLARRISRLLGLAFGIGLRQNLGEAYTWVMNNYEYGDRIYIFGFSRGAFTARALAGMLYRIGALHPGSDNLVPYAVSAYAVPAEKKQDKRDSVKTHELFAPMDHLSETYARTWHTDTGKSRSVPVHYLGVWDTVRAGGILGRELRWPYIRGLPNVRWGRHAISIDEKRRPYREYPVDAALVESGTIEEAWFAGVHSDVGGTFKDGMKVKLSQIACKWVLEGAVAQGLLVNAKHKSLKSDLTLQPEHARATLHKMGWIWVLLTYRRRPIPRDARVHASVVARQQAGIGYQVDLPETEPIDPDWTGGPKGITRSGE